MDVKEKMKFYKTTFERLFSNLLLTIIIGLITVRITNEGFQKLLGKYVNIAQEFISDGGKRLRPILSLLVATTLGLPLTDDLIQASSSIEVLHNSTLFPDDVIDEDDTRRGKPTVHMECKKFYGDDEKTPTKYFRNHRLRKAIGDTIFLSDIAFCDALLNIMELKIQGWQLALEDLIRTFALINAGQILDNQKLETMEEYEQMIQLKTGELFCSAVRTGAYFAGKDKEFAERLGQAFLPAAKSFQIADDLLDILPGKAREIGSDIRNGKSSILSCLFFQIANGKEKEEFVRYFGNSKLTEAETIRAIKLFHESGAVQKAEERRDQLLAESCELISTLEDAPPALKELLISFATMLAIRES